MYACFTTLTLFTWLCSFIFILASRTLIQTGTIISLNGNIRTINTRNTIFICWTIACFTNWITSQAILRILLLEIPFLSRAASKTLAIKNYIIICAPRTLQLNRTSCCWIETLNTWERTLFACVMYWSSSSIHQLIISLRTNS